MCHLIRPQKCRPYIVNLLPCITRLCQRTEEAIQDTMAISMTKLCPVLMSFANDSEIKVSTDHTGWVLIFTKLFVFNMWNFLII